MEVEVDGRWYTGEENCSSKKEAEHLAAKKAYNDLMRDSVDYIGQQEHLSIDSSRHLPPEYADVEDYIATMLGGFGARIRKVTPPNTRGLYRLEITGNYRYCDNVKKHHKKNQVYFLVDPVKKIYFQRCYDPDCRGFQSAKQLIFTSPPVNTNSISKCLKY